MFYSSEKIRSVLKCSYCQTEFTNSVKSISECGSLICGSCYIELICSVNKQRQFKCLACAIPHMLPNDGLADVKPIMEMLKLRPEEKALTSEAQALRTELKLVVEQLKSLESFDDKKEINWYCDQLQSEVANAVKSATEHFNKLGEELNKEIAEYRQRLLSQTGDARNQSAQHDLAELSKEIGTFNEKWNAFFAQITKAASDSDVLDDQVRLKAFKRKLKNLKSKFVDHAFGGECLKFKPNELLDCQLGKLSCENLVKIDLLDTVQLDHEIRQVLLLQNNQLATCSIDDATIKIWDLQTRSILRELNGHAGPVNCLDKLENGWLASASDDKSIKLWNLKSENEDALVKTLCGHTREIVSVKALPNGNLASCSWDNTIKVWSLNCSNEKSLLLTMENHDCCYSMFPMGLMSNGNLVTCSDEEARENYAKVWNTGSGEMIKSLSIGLQPVYSFLVLNDDRLAVCVNGSLKLFDFKDAARSSVLSWEGAPWCMLQLPNGLLVCSEPFGSESFVHVWNLQDGRMVSSTSTHHSSRITSLCLSSDGHQLASGSYDKTVILWSFHF